MPFFRYQLDIIGELLAVVQKNKMKETIHPPPFVDVKSWTKILNASPLFLVVMNKNILNYAKEFHDSNLIGSYNLNTCWTSWNSIYTVPLRCSG